MAKEILPNDEVDELNICSNLRHSTTKSYENIFSSIFPINPCAHMTPEISNNKVVEEDQKYDILNGRKK